MNTLVDPETPTTSTDKPAPTQANGLRFHYPPLSLLVSATLLVFGLLAIVSQAVFFAQFNTDEARSNTIARCKRVGLRVGRLGARNLSNGQWNIFKIELSRVQTEEGVEFAALVDNQGRLNATKKASLMGQQISTVIRHEGVELINEAMPDVVPRTRATPDSSTVMGAFPVHTAQGESYVLYLELDLTDPLNRAHRAAVVQAAFSAGLLLLFCGVLWFLLDKAVTRRVRHIVDSARDLAEGRNAAPALRGTDELAVIDNEMRAAHATVVGQAAEVRAQRERYRLMVESLPVAVITLRDGVIDFVNSASTTLLGWEKQAPPGSTSTQLAPAILQAVDQILAEKRTTPMEVRVTHPDGSARFMEVTAYTFTDHRGSAAQVVLHDVTERRASEARREAIGHEIAKASEREQRRIGQDLHDDICQRLAAIKMSMQDFEELIADKAPMLMDNADDIVDRLTDAIHVTRSLARGLSPVDIEAGGITVALSSLARTAREVLGVECQLNISESLPPLSQHMATQLYRIAQESINNAARHARAGLVTVDLACTAQDTVELRVTNDGRPFGEGESSSSGGGMGLPIMRYRAQSIGGTLEFETDSSTANTIVRCIAPIQPPTP